MLYFWHGAMLGLAGWVWLLLMFAFWVGVVALVIWAVSAIFSSSRHHTPMAPREDSAMQILRERYARGEIDTEQFEQARRTLEESRHSPA